MDGERFRVRQYFMRDYHEEGALLHALAEDLARFERLVTFNGKMFDVPLLDARFRLNRGRFPLAGAPHFDLLHPARRLWKARLESCRLQSLEAELLGLRRHGDIPGEEIPHVYFDCVRRRDARVLARVFEHNRQDIVSLAALAVLACQWVEDGPGRGPARRLQPGARARARRGSTSAARPSTGARSRPAPDAVRGPALLRLAWRAKRAGDYERAAELWARGGRGRRGGGAGASSRSTTSTGAASSQRRSRPSSAVCALVEPRARARPARVAPGRGARRRRRRRLEREQATQR